MSKRTKSLLIALVASLAAATGNIIRGYQDGTVDLGIDYTIEETTEILACERALRGQLELMGRDVPVGPLHAFCASVATSPMKQSALEAGDRV